MLFLYTTGLPEEHVPYVTNRLQDDQVLYTKMTIAHLIEHFENY